jgi:enoyl-CoA hydratase/carnithine racemase
MKLPDRSEDLIYSEDDQIATLTLNRENKLNTMTPDMGKFLISIVPYINSNDRIRVVILTGSGRKSFSAGSDISVLDQYGSNWQLRNRVDYARAIWSIKKPVIAKIHGYCIGGGLEMALMSDIRYAAENAQFGAGEIKLGWHGGAGNTQLLPRVVPTGKALEMLLTGEMISAQEAKEFGLIEKVLPSEDLDDAVENLAEKIVDNAPIAAQLAKHMVRISQSTAVDIGLQYENDTFAYCFTTEDSSEGRKAFAEKRKAHFKGK